MSNTRGRMLDVVRRVVRTASSFFFFFFFWGGGGRGDASHFVVPAPHNQ